jgi:hypothetical protein
MDLRQNPEMVREAAEVRARCARQQAEGRFGGWRRFDETRQQIYELEVGPQAPQYGGGYSGGGYSGGGGYEDGYPAYPGDQGGGYGGGHHGRSHGGRHRSSRESRHGSSQGRGHGGGHHSGSHGGSRHGGSQSSGYGGGHQGPSRQPSRHQAPPPSRGPQGEPSNKTGNESMEKRSVQGMGKHANLPPVPDNEVDQLIARAKQRQAEERRNPRPPTPENAISDPEVGAMIARAKARKAAEKRNPPAPKKRDPPAPKRSNPPPSTYPPPPASYISDDSPAPPVRRKSAPRPANTGDPSNQQGNESMSKHSVGGKAKPMDDIPDDEVEAMIARAKARKEAEKRNPPPPEIDDETAALIAKAKARAREDTQREVEKELAEERAKKNAIKAEKKRKAEELARKKEVALDRKVKDVQVPRGEPKTSNFNNLFEEMMGGPKEDDKPTLKKPKSPDHISKGEKDRAYIPKRPADPAGGDIKEDDIAAMIAKAKARRLAETAGSEDALKPPSSSKPSGNSRGKPARFDNYDEEGVDPEVAHQARLAKLRAAREEYNRGESPEPEMELEKEPGKKRAPPRFKSPPPPGEDW